MKERKKKKSSNQGRFFVKFLIGKFHLIVKNSKNLNLNSTAHLGEWSVCYSVTKLKFDELRTRLILCQRFKGFQVSVCTSIISSFFSLSFSKTHTHSYLVLDMRKSAHSIILHKLKRNQICIFLLLDSYLKAGPMERLKDSFGDISW